MKIKEPIIYDDYNGRIRADQDCIGTLTTNCGTDAPRNGVKIIEPQEPTYRIRKLTERECFRLMGVKSEDFEKVRYGETLPKGSHKKIVERVMTKAEWKVCWRIMRHDRQSMSSCYHLAGDSICVSVLMAIFEQMLDIDYEQKITELIEELPLKG